VTRPLDDPLRRVADLPPAAEDRAAADRAMATGPARDTEHPHAHDQDPDEVPAADEDQAADPDIEAGQSVGARLGTMLEHVFGHEPPVGDAIDDIFRRADAIRRRRAKIVLGTGSLAVLLITILGYAATTVLLPAAPTQSPAAETVVVRTPADPVLAVLAPMLAPSRLTAGPREPSRGEGWRQYLVRTASGHPHGLVEVSAYAAPNGLCFPVLADRSACGRPERASDTVEYARYAIDRDVDWQVIEVIARRIPDGRVIVVQASGERGTGSAQGGRPPVSGLLAARLAADPRLAAAFDADKACNGPDPACPVLKVPVPIAG
jgi:hypothetical protein